MWRRRVVSTRTRSTRPISCVAPIARTARSRTRRWPTSRICPPETIRLIRESLAGKAHVVAGEDFEIERSLPHGHVAAVWAMAHKLDLAKLLGPACPERDLALSLVIARALKPGSKLATTRWWADTTLGVDLVPEDTSTDEVYAAMDWLLARQGAIERSLATRHLSAGSMVLYDLSSSWMEGTHCPLAARGYSRDHKSGKAQIEYGLMTDHEGRPISVEVFAGNTADPTAFISAVEAVRTRFSLSEVVMVGDRGMITSARIEALRSLGGFSWITCLRAPAIRTLAEQGALQLTLFDETNLAEITHPDYPGRTARGVSEPCLGRRADAQAPRAPRCHRGRARKDQCRRLSRQAAAQGQGQDRARGSARWSTTTRWPSTSRS